MRCTFTATGMISSLKKSHLFLIVACSLLVIVGIHKQLSEGENMAQQTYIHVDLNISQHDSIFNTCELIVFNHLDPELLEFHYPGYNPKNGCIPYEPITVLHDAKVNVTEKAKRYTCKARCLYNKRDAEYTADPWISVPSEKKFECDIVETDCDPPTLYGSKESYIHSQIYEKRSQNSSSDHRPNLYVILIDSVSSFMAKRALPRTIEFLKSEFDAVQMEFLNKVGSNTRPNAFPLFFGKSFEGGSRALVGLPPLEPDWNSEEKCGKYLDEYSYYLEEYRMRGYKTMVGQDWSVGVPYYPNCLGFNRPEADHMWRPFEVRMIESKILTKNFNCSERFIELLDYLEKFMNAYQGVPKVGHILPVYLAHDTLKDLYHSDEYFLNFFEKNRHNVDESFIFFMGDHGPNSGDIHKVLLGKYEKNNPFLMVTIPKRYRNSPIHEQLRNKSLALMTHFDLHATFMDILNLQPSAGFNDTSYHNMSPMSKGSSLLREWRGTRNCRTLPIPSQYCLCQYNRTVIEDEKIREKVGVFLAEQLNSFLERSGISHKCRRQYYSSTQNATQLKDGDALLYEVEVFLTPSNGLFSAHVRSTSSGFLLYSGFTRLNRYGDQGDCVWLR
ncbi:hypothetical protein RB195_020589 [Necator americanus]|uniref:Arylsulfatase n=1 Tax=Necator americanus TaxID=51031 RepID=A0ABR1CKY8_NECAM